MDAAVAGLLGAAIGALERDWFGSCLAAESHRTRTATLDRPKTNDQPAATSHTDGFTDAYF